MSHVLRSAGYNTATYSFTIVYVEGRSYGNYLSTPDWEQLPDGRLKELLLTTYTEEMGGPSRYEQFYAALASAGFHATMLFPGSSSPTVTLGGYPPTGTAGVGYAYDSAGAELPEGIQGVLHIGLVHSIVR